MVAVGIEAMNVYGGAACLDVRELCTHRGLDMPRFENLLMQEKTVALPYEDPVTFAVNAARPLLDALDEAERGRIELVVACTESGMDFGKSLSTWLHRYLDLAPNCRLFEIKQACYSGAAGLQMAVNFLLSGTSPGAKALVVTTDISRFALADEGAIEEWAYSEPSSGAGAVAMLVSDTPHVLRIDQGAYGNHAFEVMDTCRPGPDTEAGDADLSLMAYLDCCEGAWRDYARRVEEADFRQTFDYLCFHTPFGGMVKGAHRQLMRALYKAKPAEIEADFEQRMAASLSYGKRVGNTAGGSVFLALAGTLASGDFTAPRRLGLFSYGSGCCSEFFSGVADAQGQARLRAMDIDGALDQRYPLSMDEYETLLRGGHAVRFGTRDAVLDQQLIPGAWAAYQTGGRLVLDSIEGYHRNYRWV
ncbi:hydroxymethylglutaryl-CoA synthase family protein [Alkalilimnicola sp. S0819]|uniref:hydroxymethylglutaryl-CoA synthase family protein n=1 Tax=Alkalilimnicola sp. S0819 TaxID=2613922 RepID=UPI00126144FD|nr:hydroxymethylglutaryl-CoA synthase [Alkalilimnicola sp. S0819]KAB7619601.1 hydroxymethylglutaryl-CoA synthase family protein [Alkalilimnicola sp. S0819]MPQ17605.1 3-hydroxy-3-methylglutaryl-ACP synthase [Alkalilimnicola sp. S0819]